MAASCALAFPLAADEKSSAKFVEHDPLWRLTPVAVSGPIPYFIDEPAPIGRPHDRWLAERALQAWDHALEGWLCMTPAKATDAAIRIYWGMTGDRLGLIQAIEVGPYRGAEVYVDAQPQAFDPQLGELCRRDPLFRDAVVYVTLLHETGHALGLDHTINMADAMYFGGDYVGFYKAYRAQIESLDDIRRRPGLSEEDLLRIRAQYPPQALLQQSIEELARKQAASK
ncbi:MAG: hypothetical protein R2748_10060 [Bryobacterales bacterium]